MTTATQRPSWGRMPFRALLAVVLGLFTFGMAGLHPPVAAAFAGNVLYTPNLSTYPNASANYTWSLRLRYSGAANGTVPATHDDGIDLGTSGSGEPMGFPVYSSSDNGQTWSSLSRIIDAGLLFRVSNPSTGTDALAGYYFGIDAPTGKIVLGRENSSWTRLDPGTIAIPGGVSLNTWYHLTFQHVGCGLTVTAQATTSYDQGVITYTDTGCTITNGQVGIRDYNIAASWRYFNMLPR